MTPPSTTSTRSGRRTDMLPRNEASSERNVGLGIAAVVGSLLLLVGVPVALVLLVGNPLPTTAPSRDWLTASIDADLVINVLTVLVWVVWMHFLVCFLSEFRAIRRGRMPDHVLLGGGSQLIARRLVAGVLMLSGGIAIAGGLATSVNADAPGGGRMLETVSALATRGGDLDLARAGATEAGAVATPEATASSAVAGTKHYEVVPPQGRHHDTLWDISGRLLGNPLRYDEIYQLNKDRMQPDGRRLTDADLIQPGWQLLLPGDAKGPGVRTAPASGIALTAPADAPPATATQVGSSAASAAQPAASTSADPVSIGAQTGATEDTSRIDLGDLLLGGGLVLAGLVTALTARRGLFGTPGEQEGALRLAADPVRSSLLDRALRILADTRRGQDLPMPDLAVVYLADDKVIAHVVGSPQPPAHPWRTADDGSSWSVSASDIEGMVATAPAPYPALVNVAESHGYDVLVDLEYASGLVALGGDVSVAREVAMSTAIDLATHAWSDSVDVILVGFGDDLADLAPGRITASADLDAALSDVEDRIGLASELLRRLGVQGVLTGRGTARHAELRPQVLVMSGAPSAEQVQRIRGLSSGGRTAFAAVCVGDAPGARWRFVVDHNGQLDLGVLGVTGTARRFTLAANEELTDLVRSTVKEAAERRQIVEDSSPSTFVRPGVTTRVPATRPGPDAPVAVRLLGPVRVTTPGSGQRPAREILTELVVMAALHPRGLHEAVLRSALWPRGVGDDVVASTLRDAQIWLGVDATGTPRLSTGDDGLWHLSEDVYVDWDDLQSNVLPDGTSEAAAYVRGLALADGEAFSGTPAGRYAWLAWHRSARDARALITTMASRAGTLLATGDPGRAEEALRNGLKLVPASESLWRELIRLHGDDIPDGPAGIVAEMHRTLPGHRFEPETEALVAHLAPAAGLDRTS